MDCIEGKLSIFIKEKGRLKLGFRRPLVYSANIYPKYSGLNLNQDKATKPQTVEIVRQGGVTPSWFRVNPLYNCQSYVTIY